MIAGLSNAHTPLASPTVLSCNCSSRMYKPMAWREDPREPAQQKGRVGLQPPPKERVRSVAGMDGSCPRLKPTSVLFPMVVDAQVEEREKVIIVQKHFVG